MNTILILLLAYFCGAIPAGYWVVKTLMQVDLTKVGSGGILAVVGHSKSIFLNWRGGKSAATGFGAMMAMNLPAALCAFAVFVTIVWLTRYVSLASIVAVSCSPILMYLFDPTAIPYIALCLCGAVYVVARHRANVRRLMDGTEPRIGQKVEIKAEAKS
jgi:acyl phosphate:glycerol-3-phosphate acyltransferase